MTFAGIILIAVGFFQAFIGLVGLLEDEVLVVTPDYIAQLDTAQVFADRIATTVESGTFYPAEVYHQNFVARNPAQPYVAAVATPKVDKLHKYFGDRLKA